MRTPALIVLASLVVVTAARPVAACVGMAYARLSADPLRLRPDPSDTAVRVVVARDGDATTLTLVNDLHGDVRDFALLIPIPAKVDRKQIRVIDGAAVDALDALTRPQIVRVQDEDPCALPQGGAGIIGLGKKDGNAEGASLGSGAGPRAADYGVAVETHAEVGEYDIAVLAAKDAKGLAAWLRLFKYDVPHDLEALMGDYLEHGMRLFVARVHVRELKNGGPTRLRPLQIRYKSPELLLPVRMAGAVVTVTVLSPRGRALPTSHDVVTLPADLVVPSAITRDVVAVHERAVAHALPAGGKEQALLEYAGFMAALPRTQLAALGAVWAPSAPATFATRYRVRAPRTGATDLVLTPSDDGTPALVSYRLWFPWQPASAVGVCDAGRQYLEGLGQRFDAAATALQGATGAYATETAAARAALVTLTAPPRAPARPAPPPPPPPVEEPPPYYSIAGGLALFVVALIAWGRRKR